MVSVTINVRVILHVEMSSAALVCGIRLHQSIVRN